MNFPDANQLLSEIMHIASRGICAEDGRDKAKALREIAEALANAMPRMTSDDIASTLGMLESLERTVSRNPHRGLHCKTIHSHTEVLCKAVLGNRQVVASAKWHSPDPEKEDFASQFRAEVYWQADDDCGKICSINFDTHCGANAVKKMLHGLVNGFRSHAGHHTRLIENRRRREQEGK